MTAADMQIDFAAFRDADVEKRRNAENRYLLALEGLVLVDEAYLRAHPDTPEVYKSGVVARQYFGSANHCFDDIGRMIAKGIAATDCLACWRVAELRVRGGRGTWAKLWLKARERPFGDVVLSIQVLFLDGTIENPMELCARDAVSDSPMEEIALAGPLA